MSYVGCGGTYDAVDVTGYLAGLTYLPYLERDILATAINDMIVDKGLVMNGAQFSYEPGAARTWVADGLRELIFSFTENRCTDATD